MKTHSYTMSDQEHATVLAALRYYQQQGLADDPQLRPDAIHAIAIGGYDADYIAGLDGAGLDALCDRLNTEPDAPRCSTRTAQAVADALRLAISRSEAQLGRWPVHEQDSSEHRSLRAALGNYQSALDRFVGGAS